MKRHRQLLFRDWRPSAYRAAASTPITLSKVERTGGGSGEHIGRIDGDAIGSRWHHSTPPRPLPPVAVAVTLTAPTAAGTPETVPREGARAESAG